LRCEAANCRAAGNARPARKTILFHIQKRNSAGVKFKKMQRIVFLDGAKEVISDIIDL